MLVLERLLGPLGFVRSGEAMHRWSDDRRVVQVVAPFFYSLGSARGKQTVEIGFLCPDIAKRAVPDLTVPALPDVAHCRSAWGFDFRLEHLLGEKVAAGWPAEDAVRNVLAHLRDVVERLGQEYGTLEGWEQVLLRQVQSSSRGGEARTWAHVALTRLARSTSTDLTLEAIRETRSRGARRLTPLLARLEAWSAQTDPDRPPGP